MKSKLELAYVLTTVACDWPAVAEAGTVTVSSANWTLPLPGSPCHCPADTPFTAMLATWFATDVSSLRVIRIPVLAGFNATVNVLEPPWPNARPSSDKGGDAGLVTCGSRSWIPVSCPLPVPDASVVLWPGINWNVPCCVVAPAIAPFGSCDPDCCIVVSTSVAASLGSKVLTPVASGKVR